MFGEIYGYSGEGSVRILCTSGEFVNPMIELIPGVRSDWYTILEDQHLEFFLPTPDGRDVTCVMTGNDDDDDNDADLYIGWDNTYDECSSVGLSTDESCTATNNNNDGGTEEVLFVLVLPHMSAPTFAVTCSY